jgi:glyoxylase-like metal-dependent hydrolase (beta-lactamase superfamily II)
MPDLIQDWFRVWEDQPGVWIIEEPLHSEEVKSYLVLGIERAALIDTGMGVGDIRRLVEGITSLPVSVIQSHAHNDHIGGAWQFEDVGIHPSEAADLASGQSAADLADWFAESEMSGPLPPGFNPLGYSIPGKTPTRTYGDGDVVELGGRTLEVIHAPGHSRGGLVLLDKASRTLFSTDVVYLRSLYLLNPDSSVSDYVTTLERLTALVPDLNRLYPSHGPSPIPPTLIPLMLTGLREIAAGRKPDQIEPCPAIEGGRGGETNRAELRIHEFGEFRVLVAVE